MYTQSARLTFALPQAHSLKDKRQIALSLLDKARHKFNASVAEVATQDAHQTLTIGIAVVSGSFAHAQDSLQEIIHFMELNPDAELTGVELYGE